MRGDKDIVLAMKCEEIWTRIRSERQRKQEDFEDSLR
jgi:hypothetical protein